MSYKVLTTMTNGQRTTDAKWWQKLTFPLAALAGWA